MIDTPKTFPSSLQRFTNPGDFGSRGRKKKDGNTFLHTLLCTYILDTSFFMNEMMNKSQSGPFTSVHSLLFLLESNGINFIYSVLPDRWVWKFASGLHFSTLVGRRGDAYVLALMFSSDTCHAVLGHARHAMRCGRFGGKSDLIDLIRS